MSYNKQYNTRNSGRFPINKQFVSGGEMQQQDQQASYNNQTNAQSYVPTPNLKNVHYIKTTDVEMKSEEKPAPPPPPPATPATPATAAADGAGDSGEVKPSWMKPKLPGVRKVSNRERRRRQNETLRRLLSPKTALMVLNEMTSGENISQQFTVEQTGAPNNFAYSGKAAFSFCADLTVDGNSFKGYGENKTMARNAAAEQAIREIFLKKMNRMMAEREAGDAAAGSDAGGAEGSNGAGGPDGPGGEEEPLPMIQLASFALQKLFAEWEFEGHKVPQLRPAAPSPAPDAAPAPAAPAAPAPPRPGAPRAALPGNASDMHPCSLLSYMRPGLVYQQLAAEGHSAQTMTFTAGVQVDGHLYIGKGQNKKEARKQAARAACEEIFRVSFNLAPAAAAHAANTANT